MTSLDPFPLIAPRSTERRLDHFDETAFNIYKGDQKSLLYNFVDALCGTTGAGALVNEIFLARANSALETIYFNDLDYIFGRVNFLSRSPAESYTYTPMVDVLTSEQWNEVKQKDQWYRERIQKFFIACSKGGTPEGLRYAVQAAVGTDCDIYELWRYIDNLAMDANYLGRSDSRSEVVVRPHKIDGLSPGEIRLLRDMISKIMPMETIVTVSLTGLSNSVPVKIKAATADSTYYEVQKLITPTPIMDQLPAPELLPIDLLSTEQWMYSKDPKLAPYAAFNITSEYGYHYLAGNDARSPIDTVTYGTLKSYGEVTPEPNFVVYQTDEQYTEWMTYEKADSPDNFPGGKYGLTPHAASTSPSTPSRHKLFTWSGTMVPNKFLYQAMVGRGVDDSIWEWVPIDYPHWIPIYSSVDVGVANGIAAINAWPGKFAFCGYSQGAIVAANILWELRYGSLQHRYQDLIGAVTFGNPCREAGHTFPGGIDPGGSGMAPDSGLPNGRIRDTPDWWWDFANSPNIPGVIGVDNFTVNPLDSTGTDITAIYQVMLGEFTGADYDIFERARQVLNSETRVEAIRDVIGSIKYTIEGSFAGHAQYSWSRPLPNSKLTSVQLGIQHLDTVGAANPILATSGASNPDGTPYRFAYASQKSYVSQRILEVVRLGGQANESRYRLPLQQPKQTKREFLPEYAIASQAPSRESTVSSSLTRRRYRPAILEARDPSVFTR